VLKIITKLLANRLQKIVLRIIHKNQYGFLKGRTIQDCLSWAFEFIYQCEKTSQEILLIKLDFAKDFDTIDHSAMIKIMQQMGFDEKWITWIQDIFGTGKSAVLLNGVPGRQFLCKCGVGQGDPLSPLLFVLVADLLQSAINKAFRDNILQAPFSTAYQMDFPVVQYSDVTLIIMKACTTQVFGYERNLAEICRFNWPTHQFP
jgi:retron-type reverse transcriptase